MSSGNDGISDMICLHMYRDTSEKKKKKKNHSNRSSRQYLVRNISRNVNNFLKNILLYFVLRIHVIPFSNDAPGGWEMLIIRGRERQDDKRPFTTWPVFC